MVEVQRNYPERNANAMQLFSGLQQFETYNIIATEFQVFRIV